MSTVSLVALVPAIILLVTVFIMYLRIWLFLVVALSLVAILVTPVSALPPVVLVSAGPLVNPVSARPLVTLPGVCRAQ